MKKCPRCGIMFTDDDRYCTSCGSPLEEVKEETSESVESSDEQPEDVQEKPTDEPEEPAGAAGESAEESSEKTSAEESTFEQKTEKVVDDLSEALGEFGAAAKKVAEKIGDRAKEGFEKLKEDETFNKYSDKARGGFEKVMDTPDSTSEYDSDDVENNKIISLFAYCGILFIIPLLAGKDSKYARFHTNQGIILFIFSIILAFFSAVPNIGWIFRVGGVIVVILAILGIINAVTGKARELPLIGKFHIL